MNGINFILVDDDAPFVRERTRTRLLVTIEQDPVPGWGDNAQDHLVWLSKHLESVIGHYNPEVRVLDSTINGLELLREAFPDPLTRPLYTIGDMQAQYARGKADR